MYTPNQKYYGKRLDLLLFQQQTENKTVIRDMYTHTWLFLLFVEALSAFLWILALPYALFSANTTVGSSVCLQKGIDSGHSVETNSLYI